MSDSQNLSNAATPTLSKAAAATRAQFESEYSFLRVFEINARRFGYKTAVSDPVLGKEWTYAQLSDEVNRLANAFYADGVRKGDVVCVSLFNSAEFIFAYLASEKLGAVFCPLNYNWSPREISYAFEDSRPKLFLFDSEIEAFVVKALEDAQFRPEKTIVCGERTAETVVADAVAFDKYVAPFDVAAPPKPENVSIYDEIARLYTSGTTGRSKGVPLNRLNETASANEVAMRYPIFSDDVTINTTPWFHRGGFHGGLMPTLYLGGEVVVLRQFSASVCLRNIQKRRVTILLGVPSAMLLVARRQEKVRAAADSLRLVVMMGSDLEKATCDYLQSVFTNIGFINSYGTTETFLNTFLETKDLPEMAGTAGRASYCDDVFLVEPIEDGWGDPNVLTPKDGETLGEIVVRCSAKTTGGYYNKPEETARKFRNGCLYTGDLATWDEREYIKVVGRKDDMMISAGENIYPQPIEEAICEFPFVSDCIVTCVPETTRGQALVAYVVLSDKTATLRDLLKLCSESPRLSSFTIPRYFRFVDELPYTATGKKQRFVLKRQAPSDLENGLLSRN